MCSACITIWPPASNRAVEASRRSLMFAECAERTSTAPISSQAARSAPSITCSVTGPIRSCRALQRHGRRLRRARCQPGGTTSVEPSAARSRPGPPAAPRRAPARARLQLAAREHEPARAPRSAAPPAAARARLGPGARGGHADRDELELRLVVRVAVAALVRAVEGLAQIVHGGARRARPPSARTPARRSAGRRSTRSSASSAPELVAAAARQALHGRGERARRSARRP